MFFLKIPNGYADINRQVRKIQKYIITEKELRKRMRSNVCNIIMGKSLPQYPICIVAFLFTKTF